MDPEQEDKQVLGALIEMEVIYTRKLPKEPSSFFLSFPHAHRQTLPFPHPPLPDGRITCTPRISTTAISHPRAIR